MAVSEIECVYIAEDDGNSSQYDSQGQRSRDIQKKPYHCTFPGCEARFLRPSKLERHICMHTGERRYVCDYEDCDKAYTNSSYLKRHQKTHNKLKPIFPCESCGMTFTEQHNLKRHHKRYHENPLCQDNPFKVCELCKAQFFTRKLLREHMCNVHSRKLYSCEYCSKSFEEPNKLQRHLDSSVHKTYSCEICSESFDLVRELAAHEKLEHFLDYIEFTCDQCNKKFNSKNLLRSHMQNHMRSEFLPCSYPGCDRFYFFERNLKQHIRSFHEGIKYECPRCQAKLSSKQKLLAHITRIHENPVSRRVSDTKKIRKKRCDAGKSKRSTASKLIGWVLPKDVEHDVLNRHFVKVESL